MLKNENYKRVLNFITAVAYLIIVVIMLMYTFTPINASAKTLSVGDCIDGATFISDAARIGREDDIPKNDFIETFGIAIYTLPLQEQKFILHYIDIIWDNPLKTGNQIASDFLQECVEKKF